MINAHTGKSQSADDLLQRGKLVPIGEDCYRHEQNDNPAVGIGTILSYWRAEPGEHIWLAALGEGAAQADLGNPALPKQSLH